MKKLLLALVTVLLLPSLLVLSSTARSESKVTAYCLNNQFCYMRSNDWCYISERSFATAYRIGRAHLIPAGCKILNKDDLAYMVQYLSDVIMIQDTNKSMSIDMSADHDTKTGKTTASAGVSGEKGAVKGSASGSVSTQPGSKAEGSIHGEIHIKI